MKLSHEMCNEMFKAFDIDTKRWIMSIESEVRSAEEKHPKWPKDHIHAAAILAEETGELVQAAIQHHYEKGQYHNIHKEATQVGAMVIRLLKNLPKMKFAYQQKDKEPKYQTQ